MNNRIIIENRSKLRDTEALLLVADIISQGRTDNNEREYRKHSTYVKRYTFDSTRNKRSDRFLVLDL